MRIRHSIYYTAMLTLFVATPILATGSISQIQSLHGQVWVERNNERIEANSASEIYSGDLILTSDTARLDTRLWSQVNLKLEASSKVMIVSNANNSGKDASVTRKMIKLEYGASCIEIDDILDSPVFFQIGDRVTIKFIKPVELCLSTDAVKSHIKLIKGNARLMHLSDSMLIALNEPGSEINFFNGGIFSLLSPSRASPQVITTEDPKEFAKSEVLKRSPKTVGLKAPAKTEVSIALPKIEAPQQLSKTEDLKEPPETVDLKEPSKIQVPIALPKIEARQKLSKTEDLKEPSETPVPIALTKTEAPKEPLKTEDLKQPPKTEDQKAASKTYVPIALSGAEASKAEVPSESSKTKNQKELYNVNLNPSRSYEATAAVYRRLRDSGYSAVVVDEIDNQGPLFRVSVPNFETIAAARGFIDKVLVKAGIHDARIERHLTEYSKAEQRKASAKNEEPKELSKTADLKESSNTVDLKKPSKTKVPIALSKTQATNEPSQAEQPSESSKTKNQKELYNVNLNSSRSYEGTAAVYRHLRDSGYSANIVDEIDNQGPIFRISVPNFETIADARGFIDKVVVKLGIHDAWIERHLKESAKKDRLKEVSKTKQRKAASKTEVPVAHSKTEDLKESPKMVDLKAPTKTKAPIALSKAEASNEPSQAEELGESSKTKNQKKELYNVNLNSSRSYEATAAVYRRLRDSGYSSFVIDEIDNQGPIFRVSVPNFETIAAARGFVDKVVVKLGIHDAWIEPQRSKK